MSSRKTNSQQEPKSARPPEYTIIRRQSDTIGARQPIPQSNKTKQSKKFEETEARREQQREQRYQAKRKRQWLLAVGIVALFVVLLAVALHFLANRSTATPTPGAAPSANASSTLIVQAALLINT